MRLGKILSASFLLIMAIHVAVFTAIGVFTPLGWRLLAIFGIGLAILAILWTFIYIYAIYNPNIKWVEHIPLMKYFLKRK